MSIAENHGSLYKNLEELRNTKGAASNNYFKVLGYEYYYLEEGNDIVSLIEIFKKVKDCTKPTVVHIHTLKGKGYGEAEIKKEKYHWCLSGFMNEENQDTQETYASITKDFILDKKSKQEPVIAIAAATPGIFEYDSEFRNKLGKNYTDVAIAEEHAVAYASALAKNGAKPILSLMSSFIQRTYDQLSQDLALNNSPAVILVYWGGISPMDATHTGVFDIPLISNIPNIVYLAPSNKEEYLKMLDYAYNQNEKPIAIRVPFYPLSSTGIEDNTDYSIENKFSYVKKGQEVAIISVGHLMQLGYEVVEELNKKGINATLVNPKFLTGIDETMLNELKQNHKIVLTMEDGVLDGGFGEKISRFYSNSDM
jgi:1-deoxy-D-xylulose-5-phosphate synthase